LFFLSNQLYAKDSVHFERKLRDDKYDKSSNNKPPAPHRRPQQRTTDYYTRTRSLLGSARRAFTNCEGVTRPTLPPQGGGDDTLYATSSLPGLSEDLSEKTERNRLKISAVVKLFWGVVPGPVVRLCGLCPFAGSLQQYQQNSVFNCKLGTPKGPKQRIFNLLKVKGPCVQVQSKQKASNIVTVSNDPFKLHEVYQPW
jgi:hypothetical protein